MTDILNSFHTLNNFCQNNLYTDISESNFLWAVFYAFLNFALWMLLPHFEFKYNLISKFTNGDKGKANDFLTFLLIQTGALRNLAFNEAMSQSIKINYGEMNLLLEGLGIVLVVAGFILVIITFYRMGMRGMYFGDHFGFFFKEKINAFPFSHLDNPQYIGTTAFFLGCALYYHSAAGAIITALTYVLYMVLNVVESKKLEVFYPSSDNKSKKN
jgi:methylene-fatty-acyl-phospholipid synthase